MLFINVGGQQQIGNNQKCRQIAGDFDCHEDAVVRCGVHRPMEHIPGFTQSHWMPPSVKCLRRIAPAATIVKEFESNTQSANKTQLLASN